MASATAGAANGKAQHTPHATAPIARLVAAVDVGRAGGDVACGPRQPPSRACPVGGRLCVPSHGQGGAESDCHLSWAETAAV